MPDATLPAPDAAGRLLRERRTIHLFAPHPPPRSLLLAALDAARFAPNHRLTEPWRFHLLGPETALAVARLNAELVAAKRGEQAGAAKLERWRTMPGWLVITQHVAGIDDSLRRREDYAACACTAYAAMLQLWTHGIGMKWATGPVTRHERFYELLGIDAAEEQVVGLFWYGYPAEVPPAPPRSPLADVLTECP